jgi:hypothetical protein
LDFFLKKAIDALNELYENCLKNDKYYLGALEAKPDDLNSFSAV